LKALRTAYVVAMSKAEMVGVLATVIHHAKFEIELL